MLLSFKAIYDQDIPWEDGADNNILTLPKGVKVKIFSKDDAMKRVDMKVKFPPGYVEPAHSHKSWHSICVLKGRMCVAGKDLRPGDYVFGWDKLHGPYEYPDGCEAFVVFHRRTRIITSCSQPSRTRSLEYTLAYSKSMVRPDRSVRSKQKKPLCQCDSS